MQVPEGTVLVVQDPPHSSPCLRSQNTTVTSFEVVSDESDGMRLTAAPTNVTSASVLASQSINCASVLTAESTYKRERRELGVITETM